MCFSITSYDIEFDGLKSAVQAVMGRDLKKTKTISEDAAIFLRDPPLLSRGHSAFEAAQYVRKRTR